MSSTSPSSRRRSTSNDNETGASKRRRRPDADSIGSAAAATASREEELKAYIELCKETLREAEAEAARNGKPLFSFGVLYERSTNAKQRAAFKAYLDLCIEIYELFLERGMAFCNRVATYGNVSISRTRFSPP